MSLEKEFVPYDLALRMKTIGFKGYCFAWYADATHISFRSYCTQPNDPNNVYNWCLAPTWQSTFAWFREKYKLFYHIKSLDEFRQDVWWECVIYGNTRNKRDINCRPSKTYEDAELACLEKLIEIVEKQKEKKLSKRKI